MNATPTIKIVLSRLQNRDPQQSNTDGASRLLEQPQPVIFIPKTIS
jgi:hypothetical protein